MYGIYLFATNLYIIIIIIIIIICIIGSNLTSTGIVV